MLTLFSVVKLHEAFDLFQNKGMDSLFIVSRHHQKLEKIVNSQFVPFHYKIGQRSQDLEPLYAENDLLYIVKSSVILNNEIITSAAYPFEVDHVFAHVDIDIQEDFDYANYLLN